MLILNLKSNVWAYNKGNFSFCIVEKYIEIKILKNDNKIILKKC